MPIHQCILEGKPGFKWGEKGTCYTYTPKDEESMKEAKKRCLTQAMAIGDMGKMSDLFSSPLIEVKGVEILNQFPNTHKIEFTNQDLKDIVNNFYEYKKEFKPNVKISHSDQQKILKEMFKSEDIELGEELPSLGLIKDMKIEGKSIYADLVDVPQVIWEKAVKMFKAISPEILMNFRGTGKKFIRAISLTNNPSLQHISDVFKGSALSFSGDFNILKEEGITMPDENANVVTREELASFGDKLIEKFSSVFGKKKEETTPAKKEEGTQTVSLSEFTELREQFLALSEKNNELSKMLMEKDQSQKLFSERLKEIEKSARTETAEAICLSAMQTGVPKVVVDHFKPLLMQEISSTVLTFSEVVDGKVIEAKKTVTEYIKDFFTKYPQKVKMGESTKTSVIEPGADDDFDAIEKLAEKYEKEGMTKHMALEKAGVEIRGGKK